MPTYTNLNGITSPNQQTLLPQLKTNLAEFFNWGLLGKGFFNNFSGATSGAYGGEFTTLRLVNEPNYSSGRVWEGQRINWCWETGVENGYAPTIPSGVSVNGTFYPSSGTGTYSHKINYPLGRVIFNTAIPTGSVVKCNHSSKMIQIGTEDQPWAKEIIFNTYRADQASGSQILGQNRIQLPGLIIGGVPNRQMRGLQIGGGQWVDQELYFFAYSETPWDRDKLIDLVSYQHEKTIYMYDTELAASGNRIPLDMNGLKNISGFIYPDLIQNYRVRRIFFKDMRISEITNSAPFFKAVIRANCELDMLNLA